MSPLFTPPAQGPQPYALSHDGQRNFVVWLRCADRDHLAQNTIGHAKGAHALKEIAKATIIAPTNLTKYLGVLQELRLVERRIPATVPPALQARSKQGRYHLIDPFHRFYFRFLRPHQAEITYQPDQVLTQIQAGLRAFVGQTAWEELARTWVFTQGLRGALPLTPEVIGSHWSRSVQAEVVAVSWRERMILIGECTWSTDAINRQLVRQLIEHTIPHTVAALPEGGSGWRVIPALFARTGAIACGVSWSRSSAVSR